MKLARAAADRALDDIAAPPPVAAIPGSSAGAIAQAQDQARRRAPNHGKLFAHLSRAVRQTILLQAYLAEDHPPATPTGADPQPRPASQIPASPTIADPQPDRDILRRDTLDRLDCALPIGPDGEIPVEDLLRAISEKFGFSLDQPDTRADPPAALHPDYGPSAQPHPARAAPETRNPHPSDQIAPSRSDRRW